VPDSAREAAVTEAQDGLPLAFRLGGQLSRLPYLDRKGDDPNPRRNSVLRRALTITLDQRHYRGD
jgi:hypothetical protein